MQRNTKQKQMVLDAVLGRRDHPTADDIYLDVREQDGRISRGTVYRNLGVLSASGAVTRVQGAPADRYDLRLDRHYHMRCTSCGRVWDAPLGYVATFDEQVEAATGFRVERHDTVFEGTCPECQKSTRGAN